MAGMSRPGRGSAPRASTPPEPEPQTDLARPAPADRATRSPRRRAVLLGAPLLAAGLGASAWRLRHRAVDPRTVVPLYSGTVAMDADGRRRLIGGRGEGGALHPGTRLLATVPTAAALSARAEEFAAGTAAWRERLDPGRRELAEAALADLWVLQDGLPAPVAGWSRNWRFVWPRDAAFCAVALARVGHRERALEVLAHLQGLQEPGAWFEARYVPGTANTPDGRSPQFDGAGLLLWAAGEVVASLDEAARSSALTRLEPLIDRSGALLHETTRGGTVLPPASPDYWEVPERTVTLGVAAATLAGLRAVETLDPAGAIAAAGSAEAQSVLLGDTFGARGMQRYPRRGGADSALALLGATGDVEHTDVTALRAMQQELARHAGGIAPGARWKHDGISWTPSTSLLCLAFARLGAADDAGGVLDWLGAHRTSEGSLPEKVLFDGRPAAVAPLAWTAANTLLALDAQLPADAPA